MADNIVRNGGLNGNKWTHIFVSAVIAAFSASGGLYIALGTPVGQSLTRPDPYTGAEGATLEYRLENIEGIIENHITNHPDAINQFDRRITTLEAKMTQILRNQERIIDKLEEE
jgi:hypothetical protein